MLECFLHEFPFLRNKILYQFEPVAGDRVQAISKDHGAELLLSKEARRWAQELIKLQHSVVDKGKAIRGLQSVSHAYETVSLIHICSLVPILHLVYCSSLCYFQY